jgi:hypothetical protein
MAAAQTRVLAVPKGIAAACGFFILVAIFILPL